MSVGEDMQVPEKDLDRFIKVRRLTKSNQEGERDAALRLLERWRNEWRLKGVNIDDQADIHERLTEGSVDDPSEEPPHWSDVYNQQQSEREAEWKQRFSQWGQAATSAFSWAANVASQAFAAQEARVLATEDIYTRIQVRQNPSGSMSLNVRVSPETLAFLDRLSDEQKIAYVNTVAQRVASDLYHKI